MDECYFCKTKYNVYPVIMNNKIESFAMEAYIKDMFYQYKEDGDKKDIGVCEKCRKEKIYKDNVFMSQAWFTVWVQLQANLHDLENKKDKAAKEFKLAVKRVKKRMNELDKTPEVIALHKKNNPAEFKEKPTKKTDCSYCGQNYGQLWINDPNDGDNPKDETCWWVCKPCKKIIAKQGEMSFFMGIADTFKRMGFKNGVNKAESKVEELKKEIQDIAKEDGQKVFGFKLELKGKNGKRK